MKHESDQQVQTEFNSSIATLQRIDSLLRDCHDLSILSTANGFNIEALKAWSNTVNGLYKEIYPKLNNPEKMFVKKLILKRNFIGAIIEVVGPPGDGRRLVNASNFLKHKNLTNKLELVLRRIADSKGMLITDKKSDSYAAGEVT